MVVVREGKEMGKEPLEQKGRNIETTMDIYAEATDKKKKESFENLSVKLDVF